MSSTFTIATKVSNMECRKRIRSHNHKLILAKAEVNIASTSPQRRNNSSLVTGISIDVLPQTYQNVCDIVQKQSSGSCRWTAADYTTKFQPMFLQESYERCRIICVEYAKTFYLGTLLMTEERQKAIWAIYVWCRRTDELVDGPNAAYLSSAALDRWEERLHAIFHGQPFDMLDAALAHTISNAARGRVYLPQDELAQFGLTDKDIFSRKISANWREFMKQQIIGARFYFNQAEEGAFSA